MSKKIFMLFLFFVFLKSSVLHLAITANPSRINPLLATDSASEEIVQWIFNGLFKYDKDGKIIPDLAKEYKFLSKKELIVRLKKGVLWHDGVEFTSKDVVFTYNLAISDKIFSPYSSEFRYVKSVKALDKYTLKIVYKKPYYKALEIWMIGMLPSHILEKEENIMNTSFNFHPVGTGAYILKELKVSSDIVLHANKNYFEHKPYIDKIVYHFIPDPSTKFLMLKSKKLDIGVLTPLQTERQIDDSFKRYYKIVEQMSHGYTYLGFNLRRKKFQDIRVRKAILLAMDRKLLANILFFSHARVCSGPFLPKTFAYNENVKVLKQNLALAKQLLKKAGYDGKKKVLEFEIATNSNNSIRMYAAEIIQHQLSKIGVKVKIKAMEWQAFLNTVVHPRNFDTVLLGWGLGLTPDAYSIWHSSSDKKGGFNLVGYRNKEVDALIQEAEETIDRKKLSKLYKKIYRIIAQDIPYVFLYIPNTILAVNRKIRNIEPSIVGIFHNEIEWRKE